MLERAREKEWCLDHHFVSPNESLALDSRVKNVVLVRVEEVWASLAYVNNLFRAQNSSSP